MTTRNRWKWIVLLFVLLLMLPSAGLAREPQTGGAELGTTLTLSTIGQFEADVGSSRMDAGTYLLKIDRELLKTREKIVTIGLSGGITDYNFSGPPTDTWSDPWERVLSAGVGLSLILPGTGRWSHFLAGSLDWSWEEKAAAGDSLVAGILAAAVRVFKPDRRLGFGLGVFDGLEETKVFPYAMISWRLKDKLTLQNPFSAGPSGPAGLELSWDASDKWQVGGGAAYRSLRFRLDDTGIAPDGIGEMAGIPVWLRASINAGPKTRLDLYAGALLDGELILENDSGRELESKHLDPAPLAALTLELSL